MPVFSVALHALVPSTQSIDVVAADFDEAIDVAYDRVRCGGAPVDGWQPCGEVRSVDIEINSIERVVVPTSP